MQKQIFKSFSCLSLLLMMAVVASASGFHDTLEKDKKPFKKIELRDKINLTAHLQAFYPLQDSAEYSITICADLPVNDNPKCVYKKGEPGHVFLILSKQTGKEDTITRSFGFYPRVPVSFLFKKVKSQMRDNSDREYNAAVTKKLSATEFALVLDKCLEVAKKKYNLKKYNCYDYVLEVFNAIPAIEKLPVSKVKFPFIFGKGGSPCGLYADLKKLVLAGSSWAPFISFGVFTSPLMMDQNLMAAF